MVLTRHCAGLEAHPPYKCVIVPPHSLMNHGTIRAEICIYLMLSFRRCRGAGAPTIHFHGMAVAPIFLIFLEMHHANFHVTNP